MSNPTSEQSPGDGAPQQPSGAPQDPYGVPQQPYGVPQQAYGAPQQAYGAPQQAFGAPQQPFGAPQSPYGVPAPVAGPNGLATAGLILGILPTSIIGLVVSILGINRAGKVGGTGRARAWVGAVLSVLWTILIVIIVGIAVFATTTTTGKNLVKAADPGCLAAESYMSNLDPKMTADTSDPTAFKADIEAAIKELNADAAKSHSTAAAKDMRATAKDFQELIDDLASGTVPSADLETRVTTDSSAIDTDCGHV